jgi:two-component system, NarL family, nitrate/nitrite response regulator NarL
MRVSIMSQIINVVVVDDHGPFRECLADTLNAEQDVRVVGQGASAAEAIMLVEDLRPDIVLLDLEMPGGGIPAATQIAQAQPQTRIVILTGNNEEESVRTAQLLGVWCYLLKGISARALTDILRNVYRGHTDAGCWPASDASQSNLLRYVR